MQIKQETQDSYQNQLDRANDISCPMTDTIRMISKVWALLILRQLCSGKKRFNELIQELGNISPRTLTKRLREMEKYGIIERQRYKEIPPRVEYNLNQKGEELMDCFKYLDLWLKKWD